MLQRQGESGGFGCCVCKQAVLQHAGRTLGGILQKHNSTAALFLPWPASSSAPCKGHPVQGHKDVLVVCRRQKTCWGAQGCAPTPLKKGCVRFNERNERAPAHLPARSALLESQLDSVPLLNKYLLNLLLIMF